MWIPDLPTDGTPIFQQILAALERSIRLNAEWLQRYFHLEPVDHEVLGDPASHIIAPRAAPRPGIESAYRRADVYMLYAGECAPRALPRSQVDASP
jgi:hypothetical protein